MTVELGTVNADELGLASYADTAGTAHTGSVNHDGIEADICGDFIFLGEQAAELHHDGRTDGKYLVHLLALNHFLDTYSNNTLLAVRTVVGHDDNLVRALANLVLEDDKVFATTGQNADYAIACSLQSLDDGEHGSNTNTTTCTNYSTEVGNVSGLAKGTYNVCDVITFLQSAELRSTGTNGLYHKGDGSLLRVTTCNGKGYTLAFLAYANNYEMASLTRFCN